jgi:hypothetical protein
MKNAQVGCSLSSQYSAFSEFSEFNTVHSVKAHLCGDSEFHHKDVTDLAIAETAFN